jgi:GR25 family glycosyltransferase involved in LPS biosynthesis
MDECIVENWPEELKQMFVISIREHRLEDFEKRLGGLCKYLTVVEGMNGNLLDTEQLIKRNLYKPFNKWNSLTRGELGCFFSHKAIWQKMVDENIKCAFIMEDDCMLTVNNKMLEYIKTCLIELKQGDPNWTVFFWARNPELAKNIKKVSTYLYKIGRSWGLFCYMVSLDGASQMLKKCVRIEQSADLFVSTTPMRGRYACDPMLCSVKKEHSDTLNIK